MKALRQMAPRVFVILAATGCAIGPSYKRPQVDAPTAWRTPSASEDSARTFFDSLASGKNLIEPPPAARADTPSGAATVRRPDWRASFESRAIDARAGLGWAELIKDPVLQALIDTAVQNNRDVRVAIATINEFRAEYGVAKGAYFPQINGVVSGGREKIQILPGQSTAFNVVQITANLQWELDFWGRLRRNTEAARAEYLGSEAGRQAVVLTLDQRRRDGVSRSSASSISISRSRGARSRRGRRHCGSRCGASSRGSSPSSTCASSSPTSPIQPSRSRISSGRSRSRRTRSACSWDMRPHRSRAASRSPTCSERSCCQRSCLLS